MKHFLTIWMGCLLLVSMIACEKDTMPGIFAPQIETGTATDIFRKGATLSGSVRFAEGTMAEHYGILFSERQSMAEYEEIPVTSGETDFSMQVHDLQPNATYYFCTYAHSGFSTVRGEVRSFTTTSGNAPVFEKPLISDVSQGSFHITSSLLDDGGSELMLSGFCYNKVGEKMPTFIDRVANVELTGEAMVTTITGLAPSTSYQVRAYGASGKGVAYSEAVIITTGEAIVPYVANIERKDSTMHSVTVETVVVEAGSAEVTEVGFCYSTTNQNPTMEDENIPIQGETENFETMLDNFELGTTYYIRAYAVNEYGVGYSEVFVFKTPDPAAPTLSVITQTAFSDFSVSVKADITDAGTSPVTRSGFCWSTANQMPTIEDSVQELEGPALDMILENLEPSTLYYIRAFAVNEVDTTYSEVFTFTTAEAKAPVLSAITRTASSDFSVSFKADITDAGTSPVTRSGFCWSTTSQTPTSEDSVQELEGPALNMTLENLKPSTTYYIRAFATSEVGTVYSEVFSFTTAEPKAPALSAITQTASSDFSVSVKADITYGGTSEVTLLGFCWSTTNQTPTLDDSTMELEGPALAMTLDNLEPSTTYYIRAYAGNEVGTTYSEVFTFKAGDPKAPSLSGIILSASTNFSVSVKSTITDAGTSPVTQSGFCWSTDNRVPTTDDNTKIVSGSILSMTLDELEPGTTYYIRAYATSQVGTTYSEVFTFTAAEAKVPTLSVVTQTASANFSVSVKASITDAGTSAVTRSGFCWSTTNQTPTTNDSVKELSATEMATTWEALQPGTTYYIRAFAVNEFGTAYSEVFTFTAAEAKAPTLSVITQTASANFSVSIQASITDAGTSAVTRSGFCWSTTNQTPTTNDSLKDLNTTEMATTLEALQPGTTYYIRAFAVNEFGTAYSEVFTFTAAEAKAPTLSDITQTASADFSVTVKATITDAGTSAVTQMGFCWSTTNQNPTMNDNKKVLEGTTLETVLSDLQAGKTYYIRAFAVNEFGTTYSKVFTFKTADKDAGNGDINIDDLPTNNW